MNVQKQDNDFINYECKRFFYLIEALRKIYIYVNIKKKLFTSMQIMRRDSIEQNTSVCVVTNEFNKNISDFNFKDQTELKVIVVPY